MAEKVVEPLVTQCPHCRTRFRVTHAQLTVAGGRVRCGACLAVFTGTEHLIIANETPAVSREDADSALDALLDELRREAPPAEGSAEDVVTTPTEEATDSDLDSEVDAQADADAAHLDDTTSSSADDVGAAAHDSAEGAVPDDVAGSDSETVEVAEADDAPVPSVASVDATATAATPAPQAPVEGDAATLAGTCEELPAGTREEAHTVARDEAPARAHEIERSPEAIEAPRASRERALRRTLDLDLGIDPDELVTLPRRRRRWLIWPVLLLCVAALAAQVLYLQFDIWAKDPQLRPIYAWLCPRVGCKLPEMRALDKLVSKNLVVRADPKVPGALQVDALIINEAPFPQPFPVIELRFSSMGGNLITGRRFRPDEYLAGDLKGAKLMTPMTPVHIALEVDDPGQDAVNYVMVFR